MTQAHRHTRATVNALNRALDVLRGDTTMAAVARSYDVELDALRPEHIGEAGAWTPAEIEELAPTLEEIAQGTAHAGSACATRRGRALCTLARGTRALGELRKARRARLHALEQDVRSA